MPSKAASCIFSRNSWLTFRSGGQCSPNRTAHRVPRRSIDGLDAKNSWTKVQSTFASFKVDRPLARYRSLQISQRTATKPQRNQTPFFVGSQMNLCICSWKRTSSLSSSIHATMSRGLILPKTGDSSTAPHRSISPNSRILPRLHS
jgi:hypothetical protein